LTDYLPRRRSAIQTSIESVACGPGGARIGPAVRPDPPKITTSQSDSPQRNEATQGSEGSAGLVNIVPIWKDIDRVSLRWSGEVRLCGFIAKIGSSVRIRERRCLTGLGVSWRCRTVRR
jgi:hypothetical protein